MSAICQLYVGQQKTVNAGEFVPGSGSSSTPNVNWSISDNTRVSISTAGPSSQVVITGLVATTGNNPPKPADFIIILTATIGSLTATMLIAVTANPNPSDQSVLTLGTPDGIF